MPNLWVTVFCGSKLGRRPIFAETARKLGTYLAANDLGLVYGGGHVGTMGVIADAVLAGGGKVSGVITEGLAGKEIAHQGLTNLMVVSDMAIRKSELISQGDISLTLPGAFGTLDEFFEVVTLHQLCYHTKRCLLLNLDGYYTDLMKALSRMVSEGFLERRHFEIIEVVETVESLFDILEAVAAEARETEVA